MSKPELWIDLNPPSTVDPLSASRDKTQKDRRSVENETISWANPAKTCFGEGCVIYLWQMSYNCCCSPIDF